jgi:hypothetical protein
LHFKNKHIFFEAEKKIGKTKDGRGRARRWENVGPGRRKEFQNFSSLLGQGYCVVSCSMTNCLIHLKTYFLKNETNFVDVLLFQ